MTAPSLELQLELAVDQPFSIVTCDIEEALSEPTHARLVIASTDNLDLSQVMTDTAVITVLRDGRQARRWTLRVGAIAFVEAKANTMRYAIDLYAQFWLLRFTDNTRKFRKLSAKDIISKILGECGVRYAWQTTRTTPRRNYCVQYHESNLAFIERLLEFEGIYYTFDGEGVMVLADDSPAAPYVAGESHFELVESSSAMAHGAEGIWQFRKGSATASGTATVNDYDWKKPATKLIQSKSAERDQQLEIYDYPSGYRNIPDGEYLAQIRLQALRVPARYATGEGTVVSFAPATRFDFGSQAGTAFAGTYLLTAVKHEYRNPAFDAESAPGDDEAGIIYHNEFRAIPGAVVFRPAVHTPRPTIGGYHTVMVRGPVGEEIHTDEMARFRAQFHWDREAVGTDEDSRWLRVVQESASSLFLARIGWEMNVGYIDGDPDRPLGLARDINGVMAPTYGQPGNKSRMTIKTPTSPATGGFNEVRLEDIAGAMEFYVKAERDLHNTVLHDRTDTIGMNETREVTGLVQENVDRDQVIRIGSNSTTELGKNYQLVVMGNRTDTVGGSETIDIGASENISVVGNDVETVGAVRLTIDGSIKPPSLKSMAANASEQLLGVDLTDPVGSLKSTATSAGKAAGQAAFGALKGGGGLAGAVGATKGSLQGSLQSMIPQMPTAKGVASALTGGLSDGITLDKLTDMFCHGSIARGGRVAMTRMVGGAYVNVAVRNIDTSSQFGMLEAIGGVKVTVAAEGNISESVMGSLTHTVGGTIVRQCDDDMSYSAPVSIVNVGASATLKSDEKFRIQTDGTIEIEAQSSLSLKVGGVSIKMTGGSVSLGGDVKLKAADRIAVTGKPDNITK